MNIEQIRQQAQDKNTAPEILAELATSKDYLTRQYVAANPNTPTQTLLSLGEEFPKELLNNPIFDLLLLENPNLISDIPIKTLRSLIKQDNVPESFIVECAERESDKDLLLGMAINPKISRNVLDKLTQSNFAEVVESAKLHINWSGEMTTGWQESAEDKIKAIRPLYSGAATPITHLQHEQPYLSVLAKLGWIPEFLILHWQKHWNKWEVFRDIANSVNTPPNALAELGKNDNPRIRRLVAANSSTPINTLEYLVEDNEQGYRPVFGDTSSVSTGLCKNPNTPPSILNILAEHKNYLVRQAVAQHSNCSVETLEKLAEDNNIQVCYKVASNLNTPSFLLEKLINSYKEFYIKKVIAEHPNCSIEILKKLSKDKDINIRRSVISNSNTPFYLLENMILREQKNSLIKEGLCQLRARKHYSIEYLFQEYQIIYSSLQSYYELFSAAGISWHKGVKKTPKKI